MNVAPEQLLLIADDAIEAVAQFVEAVDRAANPPKTFAELASDIRSLKHDHAHRLPAAFHVLRQ